ncbi:MAG: phosphatase PAP2 family protein [Candidatus Krumholzibacteriota bacterium]|nr:phosphatase PAP2 family protein [Candidatus Krumholzibacteriota bacterium]
MAKERIRQTFLIFIVLIMLPAASASAPTPRATDTDSLSGSAWRKFQNESSYDVKIFRFINTGLANRAFDTVMPIITDFDRSKIIILLSWSALVIFGGAKGKWAALALIPLLVASDQISSGIMKPLFQRSRPCEVLGGARFWSGNSGWITTSFEAVRGYKSSFSFPSGHAANITTSMLFLGLVYRKLLAPLLLIAATVSFSRIYVGVHWPLDVAAGITLGIILSVPSYIIFSRLTKKKEDSREVNPGQ